MSMFLTIGVTALATISALREGQQMAKGAKYNASVAEAEAEAVRRSAAFQSETLTRHGELEQARIARAKLKTLGTQQALYAKAGVVPYLDSPLAVTAETGAQYELDLATSRYNLATGLETIRYGSEVEQARLRTEAEWQRKLAKYYKTASYLKAGSTLLTGMYTLGSQQNPSVIRGGAGGSTSTYQGQNVWSPPQSSWSGYGGGY